LYLARLDAIGHAAANGPADRPWGFAIRNNVWPKFGRRSAEVGKSRSQVSISMFAES
jgi:hypothetical protein